MNKNRLKETKMINQDNINKIHFGLCVKREMVKAAVCRVFFSFRRTVWPPRKVVISVWPNTLTSYLLTNEP